MSYTRNHIRQKKSKQILGIALLIIVALVAGGIGYAKYYLLQHRIVLDPETLCPATGSPEYISVIFDKTDSYNKIQQRHLKNYFTQLKNELPIGAQIALYVIDAGQITNLEPEVILCNPGTGDHANALYENPKLIQKRWHEQFEIPLDKAISDLISPGQSANASPIFEMLQAVSLTSIPTNAANAAKHIIIVSDMLQHNANWSHYRGDMDFNKLAKKPYYQKIRTDLQGADVQILYIRRDGAEHLQTLRHANFWQQYINDMNGRVTLIERIDG